LQTYRFGLSVDRIKEKVTTILDSNQSADLYKNLIEDNLTEQEGILLEKLADTYGLDDLMYRLKKNLEFVQTDNIETIIGTNLDEAVTDYISDSEVKSFLAKNQETLKINSDVELDNFGYKEEKFALSQIPCLLAELNKSDIDEILSEFYDALLIAKTKGSVKVIIDFIYNKTKAFDGKGYKINPKSLLDMDISGLEAYISSLDA
jgi:hypothetical protein